jgi:hypothetical protein
VVRLEDEYTIFLSHSRSDPRIQTLTRTSIQMCNNLL